MDRIGVGFGVGNILESHYWSRKYILYIIDNQVTSNNME